MKELFIFGAKKKQRSERKQKHMPTLSSRAKGRPKQSAKGGSQSLDDQDREKGYQKPSNFTNPNRKVWIILVVCVSIVVGIYQFISVYLFPEWKEVSTSRSVQTPEEMSHHCKAYIGDPRIMEIIDDRVYLAIGYDLANTILIKTSEGSIVVDVSMNPTRARQVRDDLEARAGKDFIHTIIYTHSHVGK